MKLEAEAGLTRARKVEEPLMKGQMIEAPLSTEQEPTTATEAEQVPTREQAVLLPPMLPGEHPAVAASSQPASAQERAAETG